MSHQARHRFGLFVLSLIIVPLATYAVILFAKGYRPDPSTGQLKPTGILALNSFPEEAKVVIGGQLQFITKGSVNLDPGSYDVEIQKAGFQTWKKTLQIEPEVVTQATALLFPSVPSLKAVTTGGAANPILSPDGTKAAFTQPDGRQAKVYILDLTESPLGLLNRDPKLLTTLNSPSPNLIWSPDSRQILSVATASATLIDTSSQQSIILSDNGTATQKNWQDRSKLQESQKLINLPTPLQTILATAAADLVWSPKENKLLYTATASAVIPDNLARPLPGSSTQIQARSLQIGGVYVYDLEEDRNFLIDTATLPTPTPRRTKPVKTDQLLAGQTNSGWRWFPSSQHLYKVESDKIIVKEYDSLNLTTIYSGPMEPFVGFPYPSSKQFLILTNLSPTNPASLKNLYAISLR